MKTTWTLHYTSPCLRTLEEGPFLQHPLHASRYPSLLEKAVCTQDPHLLELGLAAHRHALAQGDVEGQLPIHTPQQLANSVKHQALYLATLARDLECLAHSPWFQQARSVEPYRKWRAWLVQSARPVVTWLAIHATHLLQREPIGPEICAVIALALRGMGCCLEDHSLIRLSETFATETFPFPDPWCPEDLVPLIPDNTMAWPPSAACVTLSPSLV